MAQTIRRFAWQKARELTAEVYRLTSRGKLARDLRLCWQMRDAAGSVMSNIAEGFERNRLAEFHQFLSIAKGSCGELRSQVYVALDASYLDSTEFQGLMSRTEEVGRVVGGLRASVERRRGSAHVGSS
ncbi:MAG: hypothetical protein AMXMBFR13_02660 [Phycisphaerae bacterium]